MYLYEHPMPNAWIQSDEMNWNDLRIHGDA